MELETAKGRSQPPYTEPLLNTNTTSTFTQELLKKTALHQAADYCYNNLEQS